MEKFLSGFNAFIKKQISRSAFLKLCLGGLLIFISENKCLKAVFGADEVAGARPRRRTRGDYDLVVAEGKDSYANTVKAVESMGGMGRFVRKGDVVVVKPNMAWDRTPEQAANTDPGVVGALVELSLAAGAKRVNVFDVCCNSQERVYPNSGIAKAAEQKGARVYFPDHWNVVKAHFSYPSLMEGWPILREALSCDVFINVPVLKHHGLTGLTLSMKNLMGVCSGKRGLIHVDIARRLADLTDLIGPDLTVIDATRVLVRNGPSGGNLADVVAYNKVLAATDPTLADAFACSLMDQDPMNISYIREAVARNLGSADILKAKVLKVQV